eukprot:5259383-Lingulodinium_polyedra.AAC.1
MNPWRMRSPACESESSSARSIAAPAPAGCADWVAQGLPGEAPGGDGRDELGEARPLSRGSRGARTGLGWC